MHPHRPTHPSHTTRRCRDLKTDNVFITTSVSVQSSVGYRSLVKLGDFGVSRVMGAHR